MFEAHSLISPSTSLFKVLGGLADLTNIVLMAWLLIILLRGTKKGALNGKNWLAIVLAIASVYIIKTLDSKLHIWERLSLNYSTHSALAAALVFAICWLDKKHRILALTVFVAYEVLQMLLGFHSLLDILSTLLIVVPLIGLCLRTGTWQSRNLQLN